MKLTPGFDRRNIVSYQLVLSLIAISAGLTVLLTLLGMPPGFISNTLLATVAYGISFIVSVISLYLMQTRSLRIIYCVMIPCFVFGLAGYFSGLPKIAAFLIMGSALAMFVAALALGDKADMNTETKILRIRLPW